MKAKATINFEGLAFLDELETIYDSEGIKKVPSNLQQSGFPSVRVSGYSNILIHIKRLFTGLRE